LHRFVNAGLGRLGHPTECAAAEYAEIITELGRVEAHSANLATVGNLALEIERFGAVRLVTRFSALPA
jgi:hypothetical protein